MGKSWGLQNGYKPNASKINSWKELHWIIKVFSLIYSLVPYISNKAYMPSIPKKPLQGISIKER